MLSANASTALLVIFSSVCILLVWASAWLWGRGWFVLTLATFAATLIFSRAGREHSPLDAQHFLEVGGLLLVFVFFAYFLGSRYITKTKFGDMKYQSHDALVRYLDDNRLTSPFATAMRAMGPVLLVLVLLYAGVAAWAVLTGKVD